MADQEYYSASEAAKYLNVSLETLKHWVRQDKFPCLTRSGEMVFSKKSIEDWLSGHLESAQQRLVSVGNMVRSSTPRAGHAMFDLLLRGRIGYQLPGSTPTEVIANAVAEMTLPDYCNREEVTSLIQERENIFSTAIGRGIAVPHARNPILKNETDEMLGLFFLKYPIDFKALDREPVSVIFLMLSAGRRSHLQMLQRIGFFCAQDEFLELLKRQPIREEILEYFNDHRQVID